MRTIFKITFQNIGRKKFRTILITLSIVLSVALLYTVMSMSGTITKIMEQKIKKETGNSELIISPDEKSSSPYIDELSFTNIDGLSYHIPKISAFGSTNIKKDRISVILNGLDYSDFKQIYPVGITQGNVSTLKDNEVMIGYQTAKEYGLTLGDKIKVTLVGKEYHFQISAILEDQNNILGYNLGSLSLLLPYRTLSNILQLNNQISNYFIKTDPSFDIKNVQEKLEKAYPNLKVQNLSELQDYKQMVNSITACLFLMVLAVIMISTFIIYSSFKIIVIERMPLIGTLRSIGATKRKTVTILLMEAVFYGLIGGFLGSLLGILLLTGTITIFLKNFGVTLEDVSYVNAQYLLISFLIGLLLMLFSAIIPIMKTSKKSIRSIIFAEIHNEKHLSMIKTVIGLLMIGAAFIIFRTAPVDLRIPLDGLGILLVSIGSALMIPMVSILLTFILNLLFRPIFRDSLGVTTANIKNDRTIMNNISLLAMGLGVILMINNFSSAVSVTVSDVYAKGKCDMLSFYPVEKDFVDKVNQVDGVEHIYTTKVLDKITANDGDITLPYLVGIDGKNYSKYAWDEFGSYFTDKINNEFVNSRSILLTKFLARKYDLKVGDMLKLNFNGKEKNYKIIAIVPSIMNNGTMSFINEKYLTEDGEVQNYTELYVNVKDKADMEKVKDKITGLMPNAVLPLQSLKDMQDQNVKSNNSIFFLMKAISLMAMFIGIIGILNNFTISFLSRKKVIATLRSLGLSKRKTIRNLLFEAFLCGCLGTLSGLAFGTVLLQAMSYMVEAIGIPSDVLFLSMKDFIFVLCSGILLSIISAVLPSISITKENIVDGLRYE